MHLAKGLGFRAVVVAACDDEVLPLQSRIERISDQTELDEVYTTERHLLYVACTRARDNLLVTGVAPPPNSSTTFSRSIAPRRSGSALARYHRGRAFAYRSTTTPAAAALNEVLCCPILSYRRC